MIFKNSLPKILICDDDQTLHLALKKTLSTTFEFKSAYRGEEALAILKRNLVDAVLLDLDLGEAQDGLAVILKILELQPDANVIFFSGKTDFDSVRTGMKLGAFDYIPKDASPDELKHTLLKAVEHRKLKKKNDQSQHEIKNNTQKFTLIGRSPAIEKIRRQIERARQSPAPILIFGETGTGKEVVARLLRKSSEDGSLEPFVAIDSSTIQSTVAESVLFGYEKGAFTGAEKATAGLFEEADGGVIYFDELGNMPLEIQNKLLRVIQEKEVLRMGSAKPISLEFRVICATNRNMEQMVSEGKFKDDLFQRLNVLEIQLPPLRDRKEDIPTLLEHFSKIHQHDEGEPLTFLPETLEMVENYPFPGNIRELSNLILYLYSMADTRVISPLDLPPKIQIHSKGLKPKTSGESQATHFYSAVEMFEKEFLARHYARLDGNISKMSHELGMDRSYLHSKLKNYGIHHTKGK
jgi:DNA-binding NtrC family response regulator